MFTVKPRRLAGIVRRFPKVKILVIGDVMLDEYIWGKVSRISPEAPVPVVNVQRETVAPGGAANVAHNIYSLKAKVSLAGVIGDDIWGRRLVELLHQHKVDTQGLIRNKAVSTVIKTRIIAHKQQVARIDKEKDSIPRQEDISKIYRYVKKTIPAVDGVIIEDYDKGLITQELVYCLVDICARYNKPLVVDPKKGHFLDYTGVTAVTPNLEETLAILGREYNGEYIPEEVEEAGRFIMDKWELKGLLITLGEHGMSFFERDKPVVAIPTMARDIYDVSGAGDTVVGVFTASLAGGAAMLDGAILSNMAAGIVVGKVGTAVATTGELLEAIKRNGGGEG